MTVADLQELLKEFPPEMPLYVSDAGATSFLWEPVLVRKQSQRGAYFEPGEYRGTVEELL